MTKRAKPPAPQNPIDQLNALLPRVQRSEPAAVAQARVLLEQDPSLWLRLGNMAANAQNSLINAITGDAELLAEAHHRHLHKLRADLGYESASTLEQMLIGRVVLTWLALHYAEAQLAQEQGQVPLRLADFHQRRLTQLQRRYLAAIRALATVRRLLSGQPLAQVTLNTLHVTPEQMAQAASARSGSQPWPTS